MTDTVFEKAFEVVRGSYSDEAWAALTPREITDAIYLEIRRLDALIAAQRFAPRAPPAKPC